MHRPPEQVLLINSLGSPEMVEFRRPVGCDDDHRHGRLMGFNHGRVQFHGRGTAGGEDYSWNSRGNTEAERHKPCRPLIVVHMEVKLIASRQGQSHGRRPRSRRNHCMLHSGANPLIYEGRTKGGRGRRHQARRVTGTVSGRGGISVGHR